MLPVPPLDGHGLGTRSGGFDRPIQGDRSAIGQSAGSKWGQRPIAAGAVGDEAVGVKTCEPEEERCPEEPLYAG
jgi:hypothetical protein